MNASSAPRSSTPSLQRSYQLGDRLQPRARWSNTPATTVRCTRADSVLPLPAVPPHERGQHPAQLTPAQSKLAAVRPAMHAYAIPPDPHELTTRSRRRVLCPTATRVAGAADPPPDNFDTARICPCPLRLHDDPNEASRAHILALAPIPILREPTPTFNSPTRLGLAPPPPRRDRRQV